MPPALVKIFCDMYADAQSVCYNNNNNNSLISIAPYGHNFRGIANRLVLGFLLLIKSR